MGSESSFVAVGTLVDPAPPAQIRTCRITAYGSYLGYLASKRNCFTHTEQVARRAGPALRPGGGRLPSMPSAGGLPPLFGHFVGTMRPSDSPPTCTLDFWLKAFSNRLVTPSTTGVDGVCRFSRVEFPYMPGVSDCAESCGCLR